MSDVSTAGAAGLDRELVLRAFRVMADALRQRGVRGEILLAGGAVMALVHDAARVTRDVDGLVLRGHGPVLEAAAVAAAELHLPRGWLNEGVSVYLSTEPDDARPRVFDHPSLTVTAVSTGHLFALKARAARAQDLDDLRLLAGELDIASSTAALALVDRFFPDDPLADRARAVLEDLFG